MKKIITLEIGNSSWWKNKKYRKEASLELKKLRKKYKSVKLIKEIDGFTTYYLPENLLGIIWKGKYKGQRQKWFIVKFIGNDEEINIRTKYPEFLDWKWEELSKITDTVVDFKLHVYQEIQKEVEKVIN